MVRTHRGGESQPAVHTTNGPLVCAICITILGTINARPGGATAQEVHEITGMNKTLILDHIREMRDKGKHLDLEMLNDGRKNYTVSAETLEKLGWGPKK